MAITDQAVLSEIQNALIETDNAGASWSSGHWTATEVITYLNHRQYEFLKTTGILLSRASLVTTPQLIRQPLPTDWVITHRVVWRSSANVYTEVPRGDGWEADHGEATWPYNTAVDDIPHLYADGEVPTLQLQIMPAVNDAGQLQILYVALSTALSNSGVAFTVPDEFVPAIKWGVVADMLGKVGRAHDPERATWAEQQYQLGVEAAKIMIGGWL